MTWQVTAEVSRFEEALRFFASRVVLTGAQAQEIHERSKIGAFWIGGGLQLAQVQRVFDALHEAIDTGEDFESFRNRMRDTLRNRVHAETVFRNATQRAYNAGRWQRMYDPDVLQARPYGIYDAILDQRTTSGCRSRHQTVLPLSHEWWDRNWPPRHHRCRAGVRNITEREAQRRGVTATPDDSGSPAGFGLSPRVQSGPIKPDPAKTDPHLLTALGQKVVEPTRVVRVVAHDPATWLPEYSRYGEAASTVAWGRASLERGLDMSAAVVRSHLAPLRGVRGVDELLSSLGDAPASLREVGAELHAAQRAAAALAGHVEQIAKRSTPLSAPALVDTPSSRQALQLLSAAGDASLLHPTAWKFERLVPAIGARSSFVPATRTIVWVDVGGELAHEWGHALEFLNPSLGAKAKAFLLARTAGEASQRLDVLLPGDGYGAEELAWQDEFFFPYVGKIYGERANLLATEVTSMGLEILTAGQGGWGSTVEWAHDDPEHLLFMLGQLAGR